MHFQIPSKVWIFLCISFAIFFSKVDGKLEGKMKQKGQGRRNDVHGKYSIMAELSFLYDVIPLGALEFDDLVVKSPKNYSTLVLVIKEFSECSDCEKALRNLLLLANSYNSLKLGPGKELFFVQVMYSDVSSLLEEWEDPYSPSLFYFPTDSHFRNIKEMDSSKYSFASAYRIADWIKDTAGIIIRPVYKESPDYFQKATILLCILTIFLRWNMIKEYLVSDAISKCLMILTLVLISGMVYNYIHGVPFVLSSSSRGITLIYPNTQHQTFVETWIIFLLYSCAVYGGIQLIEYKSPENNTDEDEEPGKINPAGFIGIACSVIATYALFSIYHLKLSGG